MATLPRHSLRCAKFLVGLRQLLALDELGVVGGRVVVGIDAVPAPVGIARLRDKALGLRRIDLRQHRVGQPVHRRRHHHVPAVLLGAEFDRDAADDAGVGGAHIADLDAGRVLEDLVIGQRLLLVHRAVDDQRALPSWRLRGASGRARAGPARRRASRARHAEHGRAAAATRVARLNA